GGLGVTLNMIVSKHPTIEGINFDQPHVIHRAPIYPGIEHIGGDMFDCVPQGDVIFMKLLKNCYNALPDDGKVISIEANLPFLLDTGSATKVTTHLDTMLMTKYTGGKERTEDEYLALFKVLGFYMRFEDDSVESAKIVKQWNVKIISISKNKRHQDRAAALDVWDRLEEFVRSRSRS
nr:caffeic acid 3-O-methyltransferase-like [Tanacetum cinerariifolium]